MRGIVDALRVPLLSGVMFAIGDDGTIPPARARWAQRIEQHSSEQPRPVARCEPGRLEHLLSDEPSAVHVQRIEHGEIRVNGLIDVVAVAVQRV